VGQEIATAVANTQCGFTITVSGHEVSQHMVGAADDGTEERPMDNGHDDGAGGLGELERALTRLPDVSAARVVGDDRGRPIEVHVLAATDKHPKQIVRDIQSVAMASFGIDLDRRMVSVVRLDGGGDGAPAGAQTADPRIVLRSIAADQHEQRAILRVTLDAGDRELVGTASGSLASTARLRIAALATMDALGQLMSVAELADVETATLVRSTEREVAVVNIVFGLADHEEVVSGSAVVREAGEIDAVVRAVLDATNRRMPMLQSAHR
jgi:hypothetical protein